VLKNQIKLIDKIDNKMLEEKFVVIDTIVKSIFVLKLG